MLELAVVAFTTFFITIGPVDVAFVFAALTASAPPAQRRLMAIRGTGIATLILLPFVFFGESALGWMGISLAALQTAGGILLFLIGVDMVFARNSGGVSATEEETQEARGGRTFPCFRWRRRCLQGLVPWGRPSLMMSRAGGERLEQLMVILALLAVLVLTLGCLLVANRIQKLLGATGAHVLARVFGVLLCARSPYSLF